MKQKSHKMYIELIFSCPTTPGCRACPGGWWYTTIYNLLLDDTLFMNSVSSFINQWLIPMLCPFKSFFCPGSYLECFVSLLMFIIFLATTCCLTQITCRKLQVLYFLMITTPTMTQLNSGTLEVAFVHVWTHTHISVRFL